MSVDPLREILVVGSVAYDSVTASLESRKDTLGGSATYFAISGSYYAPVAIVAVVGTDFAAEDLALLESHRIDISGLKMASGETFRWAGKYAQEDMDSRKTLETRANVFADFQPVLTPEQKRKPYLFLANVDPEIQLQVLKQMEQRPRLVVADTILFWIEGKREALTEVIRGVDVMLMDEGEMRLFAGEINITRAARYVLSLGPQMVIVKRGERGLIQFMQDSVFSAPAYPLQHVVDPTGAGDSFAGGFMGYVAASGDLSPGAFRRASILGSVMGSFAVGSFSVERLGSLTQLDITGRFREFSEMAYFDGLAATETLPWRRDAITRR